MSLEKAGDHKTMCQMLQQSGISYVELRRVGRHRTELCCAEIPGSRTKHRSEALCFSSADLVPVFPVEAQVTSWVSFYFWSRPSHRSAGQTVYIQNQP